MNHLHHFIQSNRVANVALLVVAASLVAHTAGAISLPGEPVELEQPDKQGIELIRQADHEFKQLVDAYVEYQYQPEGDHKADQLDKYEQARQEYMSSKEDLPKYQESGSPEFSELADNILEKHSETLEQISEIEPYDPPVPDAPIEEVVALETTAGDKEVEANELASELDAAITEVFELREALDEANTIIDDLTQEREELQAELVAVREQPAREEVVEEAERTEPTPIAIERDTSDRVSVEPVKLDESTKQEKVQYDSKYVGQSDDGFEGETYRVRMKYLRFIPGGDLTVPAGSRVRFVNEDKSQYNLTFSDGTESGILEPGAEYDYVPSGTVVVDSLINPDSVSELTISTVSK